MLIQHSEIGTYKYVPKACAALNRHIHASTGKSPYELLFGVKPTYTIDFWLDTAPTGPTEEQRVTRMEAARRKALAAIIKAQTCQSRYYNAKRRNIDFEVNSKVLVSSKSSKPGITKKLCPLVRGPYKITSKVTPAIYELNFGS